MTRAYKYDGLDKAIIGVGHTSDNTQLVVYSYEKIIAHLMEDMSYEDAVDYADFNILGLHIGRGQPVIVFEMTPEQALEHFDDIAER